jgi:hypothetical protein
MNRQERLTSILKAVALIQAGGWNDEMVETDRVLREADQALWKIIKDFRIPVEEATRREGSG